MTVQYQGLPVFDGLSVAIDADTTAITGPSGSGKSTLLRVLAGHQQPLRGTVTLGGKPLGSGRRRSADPRVGFIYQDFQLVDFLTAQDNLLLASEVRGLRRTKADARLALASVGLGNAAARRRPEELSGGEQQRVAIARALFAGPEILFADEPTGALDASTTDQVLAVLEDARRQQGVRLVVATHDHMVARAMEACLILDSGHLRPAA